MTVPTTLLPEHHRLCDDAFVAAENAVGRGDWAAAKPALERFQAQMHAHFDAEENVLFPEFEEITGMTQGPTQMMRYEHEQMRALLEQLDGACSTRDADGYAGAAETLLMLMQQHNIKEENILYPMCDRALGNAADTMGERLRAVLEGANG